MRLTPYQTTRLASAVRATPLWQRRGGSLRVMSSANVLPEEKWWTPSTVAVVTGSNKGIGRAIAAKLAEVGLTVVMTARSEERGQAALQQIRQLPGTAAESTVLFHQLDITDQSSVDAFKGWLVTELGRLDILVNNAGFAYKGNAFGTAEARVTLGVNYAGTKRMCEALAPLMAHGGRIVNVSSTAGRLSIFPGPVLRQQLEHPESVRQLDALAEQFPSDIEAGRHVSEGWPSSMYGVSKALETAYTRVLAVELRPRGIMVNACHPGYVATDMSSQRGHKAPEQGAETPVWLAMLPPKHFVTGGFFSDQQRTSF